MPSLTSRPKQRRERTTTTMMMMMINNGDTTRSNPTVQVPPWTHIDDPTVNMPSPFSSITSNDTPTTFDAVTAALRRYLPSNTADFHGEDCDIPVDAFACDHFRMFEFKVRKCARGRSHDWTECPYAHPGEKARRRDPRKFHYSGTACTEFRKGQCVKGDSCEFAHGVFECWLHPARYRTQPCKDGTQCRRRVCFFAHTPDQLRVLPTSPRMSDSFDGSAGRLGFDSYLANGSPPVSPPSDSPPMSPNSVSELAASMRSLQIGKVNINMSQPAFGFQIGSGFCSPRSPSTLRPAFRSLPTTPTQTVTRSGLGVFDLWEQTCEEEPVMERVESGRGVRAKIYAKLSKENSLGRGDSAGPGPDIGWVSELIN
ncbi:hypothetical protein HYC85_023095 [Camellia sinensis]|uniref:C3H1-type domain-containing protein n=1 Tax=Camellia sinensis TaxID=4442 RepID=A0A7J7GHH6_CAMSI|nr:hypothetical protein HYC85_023095 [Camellia sinensis]